MEPGRWTWDIIHERTIWLQTPGHTSLHLPASPSPHPYFAFIIQCCSVCTTTTYTTWILYFLIPFPKVKFYLPIGSPPFSFLLSFLPSLWFPKNFWHLMFNLFQLLFFFPFKELWVFCPLHHWVEKSVPYYISMEI